MPNDVWAAFLAGCAFGLVAGWELNTMRYARRAARDARRANRKVDDMMRDDDTGTIGQTVALGVVVVITALAAVLSGISAQRTNDTNERVENLATCTQDILERTIRALNERTAFSDDQADARRSTLVTQRDLVALLTDRRSRPPELIDAAHAYQRAVARQLRLDDRNDRRRVDYPYPTAEQIRACD